MFTVRLPGIFLVAAIGATASAQNVVGTWHGRLQFTLPPLKPNATAQERQQRKAIEEGMNSTTMTLTLKKDRTCVLLAQGMFLTSPPREDGTWTLNSKKLTLSMKSPTTKKTTVMNTVLSNDGKTITYVQKTSQASARLVLRKG